MGIWFGRAANYGLTSGITPKILEFVKRSEGRVRLSIRCTRARKLNAVSWFRSINVILEGTHRRASENSPQFKKRNYFEYTVIADVNDSLQEAEGVAKIARPLNAKVNLIPYNPIQEMDFKTPTPERVNAFRDLLMKARDPCHRPPNRRPRHRCRMRPAKTDREKQS